MTQEQKKAVLDGSDRKRKAKKIRGITIKLPSNGLPSRDIQPEAATNK